MVSQETQDKLKEIRSSFRLLMNGPVSQSMRVGKTMCENANY